jgi:hypothetical protein
MPGNVLWQLKRIKEKELLTSQETNLLNLLYTHDRSGFYAIGV